VEITQGLVDDTLSGPARAAGQLPGYRGIGALQPGILCQFGAVFGQHRQGGVVSFAPLLRFEHAIEVTHGRPDTRQFVLHLLEWRDQRVEIRLGVAVEQGLKLLAVRCDKLAERRQDLLRRKLIESRQRRSIEERVGHTRRILAKERKVC